MKSAERQPSPLAAFAFLGMKEVFVPASEKDIAAYRDEKYPQWLKSCKSILRQYHDTLNHGSPKPSFSFAAFNEGTRPGKDALISIEAKGNFAIMPPSRKARDDDDDDGQEADQQQPVELPRPPVPPRGKWRSEPSSAFGMLEDLMGRKDHLGMFHNDFGPLLPNIQPFRRDPNGFYYKPERPKRPQSSISLECEQWRHGPDHWADFAGEIHFAKTENRVVGVLECRIHVENLSESEFLCVPVRIEISSVSVLDRAERLVEALAGSLPIQRSQIS